MYAPNHPKTFRKPENKESPGFHKWGGETGNLTPNLGKAISSRISPNPYKVWISAGVSLSAFHFPKF